MTGSVYVLFCFVFFKSPKHHEENLVENLKIEDERQKKSHALFQAIDAVLEVVVVVVVEEKRKGLLFLSSGDLPDPRIKHRSPALQADSLPFEL